MWLQRRLPRHHLDKPSEEVVKICGGMIATIAALVLGLLVSSAKSNFDTVNEGIKQASAKIILMDRTLAQYGPEGQGARDQLKCSVLAGLEAARLRHSGQGAPASEVHTNRSESFQALLRTLTPQTDLQRQLLSQAQQLASDVAQSRWTMMEEEQDQLPVPLLAVLIGWMMALFVTFGMFAPRNATVLSALFISAGSMAAAIFLILELNQPLDGVIHVSTAPLHVLVQQIGR